MIRGVCGTCTVQIGAGDVVAWTSQRYQHPGANPGPDRCEICTSRRPEYRTPIYGAWIDLCWDCREDISTGENENLWLFSTRIQWDER